MNDYNRTPATPHASTSPQPPTVAGGALPALNEDGIDCRSWWQLDATERAARMDRQDQAWWTRHRLWTAADALRAGIIEATGDLR